MQHASKVWFVVVEELYHKEEALVFDDMRGTLAGSLVPVGRLFKVGNESNG